MLSGYVEHVQNLALLSHEQEISLARRWREHGDQAARNLLVQSHLRCVLPVARRYCRCGAPLSELVAEGNLGLLHASSKFEPERGYRFATYAKYWIRAYVSGYSIGSGSAIRYSRGARAVRREHVRATNLVGDNAEIHRLIAERLQMSAARVDDLVAHLDQRQVSFASLTFERRGAMEDPLCAKDASPEQAIMNAHDQRFVREAVRELITDLSARERRIVDRRLMADAEAVLTLEQLGREFGVSRERVRQLEACLKCKLAIRFRALSKIAGGDWWAPEIAA